MHIQTVGGRHSQIKSFLRRFCGLATKRPGRCPRQFHLVGLRDQPSPRACLVAAMNSPAGNLKIEPFEAIGGAMPFSVRPASHRPG